MAVTDEFDVTDLRRVMANQDVQAVTIKALRKSIEALEARVAAIHKEIDLLKEQAEVLEAL